MFGWFAKKDKFPQETLEGNIYIKGEKIYYHDHGNEECVDLSKLKYAYVEILGDRPFLFLFDYYQHYIEVFQKGFSKVYPLLSKKFGFDDDLFFKTIHSKKEQKHRIWIKQQSKNYQIIDYPQSDFNEGFEVMSHPPQFISWDTSYAEFAKKEIGHSYISDYDINVYKFDYPVRIGALLIEEFEFYNDNVRQDIAVQFYFATLNNGQNTDASYRELRKLWMKQIPTKVDEAGYEREDQKYLTFNLDGMGLSICYTYDVDSSYDDGCTSLGVNNYRDYSHIILKERNHLKEETTDIIILQNLYEFIPKYQNNNKVHAKPYLIEKKAKHHQAIYIDTVSNTLGFASDQYSIEFDIDTLDRIIIQNVLPAKGSGYVELSVKPKGTYNESIFYGDQNSLDQYASQLAEYSGLQVELPEPYHNC